MHTGAHSILSDVVNSVPSADYFLDKIVEN